MSSAETTEFDVVVIGGGIAGVSIGYELAQDQAVCLVEQESSLAFHTTGRSAALYLETFGNRTIRALTTCSRAQMTAPPQCFDTTILTPMQYVVIAREGRGDALREFHSEVSQLAPSVELISPETAQGLFPFLDVDCVEAAMLDPDSMEIDVHALHQGYVRGMRRRGAQIRTRHRVLTLVREDDGWTVGLEAGETLRARTVVNAAGAWADELAEQAGVEKVGLVPMVRTIFATGAPNDEPTAGLAVISDFDDTFYIKPEGTQFLCSPADETPSHPHDARPDELEIARAIDEINELTNLKVRHVRSSWAGLRTFAADRSPVVGFDPHVEGFFWFAGQGGYGIQICDALARVGAQLISSGSRQLPEDVEAAGVLYDDLAPERLK